MAAGLGTRGSGQARWPAGLGRAEIHEKGMEAGTVAAAEVLLRGAQHDPPEGQAL